jgi:hypothetical protein
LAEGERREAASAFSARENVLDSLHNGPRNRQVVGVGDSDLKTGSEGKELMMLDAERGHVRTDKIPIGRQSSDAPLSSDTAVPKAA